MKFCPYCSLELPRKIVCACGCEMNPDFSFCPECGAEAVSQDGNHGKQEAPSPAGPKKDLVTMSVSVNKDVEHKIKSEMRKTGRSKSIIIRQIVEASIAQAGSVEPFSNPFGSVSSPVYFQLRRDDHAILKEVAFDIGAPVAELVRFMIMNHFAK